MDFFSFFSVSSLRDDEQSKKIAHLAKVVELLCEKMGVDVVVETLKEAGWFSAAEVKITLKDKIK